MDRKIQEQLDLLPLNCGVYKFFSQAEELLYIGKAINLKSRVSSYFRDDHIDRPHIIPMIPEIYRIDYIETENEIEALVLESALIKQNQPRYNVEQKDGKSYAWIYINTREEFPTVKIVRSIKKGEYEKGRLFGPYPSGRAVRQVFRYIRKLYPFCTSKNPKEPCLYYHIGMCPGPYFGYVTKDQYRESIYEIIKFLEGKRKRHLSGLESQMKIYARTQQFEKAAEIRDKIEDLKHLGHKVGFSYYNTEEEFKSNREHMLKEELQEIAEQLGLRNIHRIECYDISNTQGTLSYGSMVVNVDGVNKPQLYRVFKIKTLDTPNDFYMLSEVLKRRLKYIGIADADESLGAKPDLILIDGGKGQLSAVRKLIPEDIFLLGISKGRSIRRKGGRKKDQFWLSDSEEKEPVRIRNHRILSSLRDEAHRFAIKHHRKARQHKQHESVLDKLEGIGPKRRKALLKEFKSIEGIKKATLRQLTMILRSEKVSENLMKSLEALEASKKE